MQLGSGMYLTYLPARKFKTSLLSAQFVTPLRQETAAACALLPAVLRRGTVRYPDLGALSARLDRLYGASVDYTVRKQGENQCVGFVASFIDDSFIPGGEQLLEPVAELVGELLCDPVTERGRFVGAYFESEKTNLIDAIRSQMNDKREYAYARLLREMCDREPYGLSRLGDAESAERLQLKKLHALYGELLSTARLELFYCGSAPLERVEAGPVRRPGPPAPGRHPGHRRRRAPSGPERGEAGGGGHGRDPGQAGHGLRLRQRRPRRRPDGQHPLRRQQQLQAVPERAGEAVPVLLRLLQLPPAEADHHRLLRHRVPELPEGL